MQYEDRARIRAAVQRLVNYNWKDEEADFRAVPSEDHIFTDLVFLQSWLSEGDVDAAADDAAREPKPGPAPWPWIAAPRTDVIGGWGIWHQHEHRWFTPAGFPAPMRWGNEPAGMARHLNEKEARA
jgi:hypothetical protein